MFKPFARIALCCNTVMRMKRPGQFTNCTCGETAIDAGDGFIMRTVGNPELIAAFATKDREMIELYRPELDSAADVMVEAAKRNVKKGRSVYMELGEQLGMTRQEAKRLFWAYLYSPVEYK